MDLTEIKKRLGYIKNNNLFDAHYINDMNSLIAAFESMKSENVDMKNDFQRIHERVEEAIADQPDNYASFLAVEDIQEVIAKWTYPSTGSQPITLRPVVQWFAEQMELKLKANDHKTGWKQIGSMHLLSRLKEETSELEGVVYFNEGEIKIISEAADVANFAMMIADNSRVQDV